MYFEQFIEAVERTKRLGLDCPQFVPKPGMVLDPDRLSTLPERLFDEVGFITPDQVIAQCFSIHYRLQDVVSLIFQSDCFYTIGYVEMAEGNWFFQTEESLKEMLAEPDLSKPLNIHVWLTFPTMEIMDFSLPITYKRLHNLDSGGDLIANHADQLSRGMKYHPLLVGDSFLRKLGALKEKKWY